MTEEQTRWISSAKALSAFANPTRSRIYDALSPGPATATALADRLAVAIGSVSHHLKVLLDAELIEEVPDRAKDRRERWWKQRSRSISWSRSNFSDDPAALAAAESAENLAAARQFDRVQEWLAASDPTGPWAKKAFHKTAWFRLSPDELAALSNDLQAVITKWSAKSEGRPDSSDGTAPVYLFMRGFPSKP